MDFGGTFPFNSSSSSGKKLTLILLLVQIFNGNIRTICVICSEFTIKTIEQCRSGVFIVNWTDSTYCSGVSIIESGQVNAGWVT